MVNCDKRKLNIILKWCQKKFGKSKYNKKYPKIYCCVKNPKQNNMGWYDPYKNIIRIYVNNKKMVSYEVIVSTVLHEYKHYLQKTKDYSNIFYKILKTNPKITNDNDVRRIHPHELKCEKFEKRWANTCYNEIKNELHKRK